MDSREGWHFMLHSCGRVNDFVPYFIAAGVDVVNLQQPQTYGIRELVALWSTAEGGFIVFNYGKGGDIGVSDAITQEMFREFARQMNYWSSGS